MSVRRKKTAYVDTWVGSEGAGRIEGFKQDLIYKKEKIIICKVADKVCS